MRAVSAATASPTVWSVAAACFSPTVSRISPRCAPAGHHHPQRLLLPLQLCRQLEQHADAGAVDERELAQVDHQPAAFVADRGGHALAELGGVRSIDLAGEMRDRQPRDRFELEIGERHHGAHTGTMADSGGAGVLRNSEDEEDDVVARLGLPPPPRAAS